MKSRALSEILEEDTSCFGQTNWRYHPPFELTRYSVELLKEFLLSEGWKIRFNLENLISFTRDNDQILIVPKTSRVQIRIYIQVAREERRGRAERIALELERSFAKVYGGEEK